MPPTQWKFFGHSCNLSLPKFCCLIVKIWSLASQLPLAKVHECFDSPSHEVRYSEEILTLMPRCILPQYCYPSHLTAWDKGYPKIRTEYPSLRKLSFVGEMITASEVLSHPLQMLEREGGAEEEQVEDGTAHFSRRRRFRNNDNNKQANSGSSQGIQSKNRGINLTPWGRMRKE